MITGVSCSTTRSFHCHLATWAPGRPTVSGSGQQAARVVCKAHLWTATVDLIERRPLGTDARPASSIQAREKKKQ